MLKTPTKPPPLKHAEAKEIVQWSECKLFLPQHCLGLRAPTGVAPKLELRDTNSASCAQQEKQRNVKQKDSEYRIYLSYIQTWIFDIKYNISNTEKINIHALLL